MTLYLNHSILIHNASFASGNAAKTLQNVFFLNHKTATGNTYGNDELRKVLSVKSNITK